MYKYINHRDKLHLECRKTYNLMTNCLVHNGCIIWSVLFLNISFWKFFECLHRHGIKRLIINNKHGLTIPQFVVKHVLLYTQLLFSSWYRSAFHLQADCLVWMGTMPTGLQHTIAGEQFRTEWVWISSAILSHHCAPTAIFPRSMTQREKQNERWADRELQ